GEPFPLGYVDQNNTPHGPFQLDNTKIRNKWITVARSLGSPIDSVQWEPCLLAGIQADGYYQAFERGDIGYCGTGEAAVSYDYTTFLPRIIASEDANAWNSTVSIRNVSSSSPTMVSITFLTRDGRILDSRLHTGLAANATWEVGVRGILYDQFLSRADSNSVFEGSAVVASDQDVAVVVRTEKSDRVTAYTGLSMLDPGSGWGRPATIFYAPTMMWNAWGTSWKSYLYIQNTTSDPANLTVTYCYQDNPASCHNETSLPSLPPFGSARVDPGSEMGSGFWGFARVSSTNGKALAVVVTQEEDTAGASDYNALSSGATKVYLPSLMYSRYNWSSSFTVQNLGSQTTYVDVTYYGDNGQNYGCRLTNLSPGASCLVTQGG
ncbi:MAG: hypothetical protein ACP5NB_13900, partial [Chloroflexia bacterium]